MSYSWKDPDSVRVEHIYRTAFGQYELIMPKTLSIMERYTANVTARLRRLNEQIAARNITTKDFITYASKRTDWDLRGGADRLLLELLYRVTDKPFMFVGPTSTVFIDGKAVPVYTDEHDFHMNTYIMDVFGDRTPGTFYAHYFVSNPIGENTAAMILSGSIPVIDRKYFIFNVFDDTIWATLLGFILTIYSLVKLSLWLRAIPHRGLSELWITFSGLLTRTAVTFRNVYQEQSRFYSVPYRCLLVCVIIFSFWMGQYFAGQFLSFLLHEPTYQYRTFHDLSEAPKEVKIIVWENGGAFKCFTAAGDHYARVAYRMIRLPVAQVTTEQNLLSTSRGESILILNKRQMLDVKSGYGKYLKVLSGDETMGNFMRIKPIRRNSRLSPVIMRITRLMLERGLVEFEDRRERILTGKVAELRMKEQNHQRHTAHEDQQDEDSSGSYGTLRRFRGQMKVRILLLYDMMGPLLIPPLMGIFITALTLIRLLPHMTKSGLVLITAKRRRIKPVVKNTAPAERSVSCRLAVTAFGKQYIDNAEPLKLHFKRPSSSGTHLPAYSTL